MERYAAFRPTAFDPRGLNSYSMGTDEDPDRSEWLVLPVSQTRDSGCFDRCNFLTAERLLRDADPEGTDWENHRFGHWGPGWFEIIVVRPGTAACKVAEDIEASLADYPSLDDDKLSEMEWDEALECWAGMSVSERLDVIHRCQHSGASIFAARRDELPQDDDGSIMDYLRGQPNGRNAGRPVTRPSHESPG